MNAISIDPAALPTIEIDEPSMEEPFQEDLSSAPATTKHLKVRTLDLWGYVPINDKPFTHWGGGGKHAATLQLSSASL